MPPARRPRVLVTNDDGIYAPGLRSLVAALAANGEADIYVCSPSGERSAQSMAITMGKSFAVFPIDVPGAKEAYAVDGTPADTVMLGLNAPIWSFDEEEGEKEAEEGEGGSRRLLRRLSSAGGSGNGSRRTLKHARSFSEAVEEAMVELKLHSPGGGENDDESESAARSAAAAAPLPSSSFFYPHSRFDLVASGTNKGDNLGHHCWYSGTVGAAREGALSALPSIAFSLDDHFTRDIDDYDYCSEFASAIVSAVLGLETRHRRALIGHVLNVNFPTKRKCSRRAAEREAERGGGERGVGERGGGEDGGRGEEGAGSTPREPERMRAIALTTQGGHCWRPGFDERYLRVGGEEAEQDVEGEGGEASVVSPRAAATAGPRAADPDTRYFKNVGGGMWEDRETPGTDSWAVDGGMASVVVLGLKQHALTRTEEAHAGELEEGERATEAGKEVVERAAAALGVEAVLLPRA